MPEHGAAVALGGALGSVARVALTSEVPHMEVGVATFLVNVLGTFGLALLLARTDDGRTRAFLGTGVLGSWTTFSALAVLAGDDLLDGDLVLGIGYAVASVVAGLLGLRSGRLVAA